MNNLLKVLDMSEKEQQVWLIKKEVMVGAVLQCKGGGELPCPSEHLADLAFRLRDETKNLIDKDENWGELNALYEAQKEVYTKVTGEVAFVNELSGFWMFEAQPIHWIIAALIAKEK